MRRARGESAAKAPARETTTHSPSSFYFQCSSNCAAGVARYAIDVTARETMRVCELRWTDGRWMRADDDG
jgi:hypothetical protein